MEIISKLIDPYDRQARLYPALIAIAPMLVFFACFYGEKLTMWSSIGSILVGCGALYLLASVARNAGKRIEEVLFEEWGGKPTTQLLRHRDATINAITKERYHAVLSKGIGKPFPNMANEQHDPAAADVLYQAGVHWLIENTRNTKTFGLLFKENIAYGFHRNMAGLRSLAITIALVAILAVLVEQEVIRITSPFLNVVGLESIGPPAILSLVTSLGLLVAWIVAFKKEDVRRFAFVYSERLLQACEALQAQTRRSAKAKE